jgi:hypothetical protein
MLPVSSNPVQAEPQFCIVANNSKTVCGPLKAIERACMTTDGSNSICGKFKSVKQEQAEGQETSKPSQSTVARKEADNFIYTLKGCRKSDTTVKCELSMVNKGKERSQRIYTAGLGGTTSIDTTGKSNVCSTSDIGGQEQIIMTPGIDYSASITFNNVPEQILKAQLLNISTSNGGIVQFRNVPFSN